MSMSKTNMVNALSHRSSAKQNGNRLHAQAGSGGENSVAKA